jgi:hypothetical protein
MYEHAGCMKVECLEVEDRLYLLQEATAAITAAWIYESRKFWYFSLHSQERLQTFTKNVRCVECGVCKTLQQIKSSCD